MLVIWEVTAFWENKMQDNREEKYIMALLEKIQASGHQGT